ncbi:MAG: STAS domain-containing protein [Vicinamibacterales bacterium]
MFQRSKQGAVEILAGNTPLTREHLDEVAPLLEQCLSAGQPRVVVDLARVPLIDSAGLELLLDAGDRCAQRGGQFKLAAPNDLCRDILRVTDVIRRFGVFDDVLAAVGSCGQ